MRGKKITKEEFIQEAKSVHGDRYDYSLVEDEFFNLQSKVQIKCNKHDIIFEQSIKYHLGGQGCNFCGTESMVQKQSLNIEEVLKRFKRTHGDKYCYDFVEYKSKDSPVDIVCLEHGLFRQSPSSHWKGSGCPECGRKKRSRSRKLTTERFIKRVIENHGEKYDFSLTKYKSYSENVTAICKIHGKFECMADYLIHKHECCPKCIEINKDNNKKKASKRYSKGKEKFIKEALEIHGDKYDYSLVKYKTNKDKVILMCDNHGEFEISPVCHVNGKSGCQKCSHETLGERLSMGRDGFIRRSRQIFGDYYKYDKVEYVNTGTDVTLTCPKHGDFQKNPGNHLSQHQGCPKCNDWNVSKDEKRLFDFLKKYNKKIIQSDKNILGGLEIDIFIPDKNIAIEFNGLYWHSENCGKGKDYHLNKTNLCNKKGVQLIHIFESEWKLKNKIVKSRLKNALNLNKYKIFARKCEIKEVDAKVKNRFLEKYHIQGADRASVKLGLFYKNRLVAVMTFCKNRKALGKNHIEGEWELSRYVTINGFSIVGGAGKLLKYFERNWSPKKITSYADIRWSQGNLYYKLGFEKIHQSNPNYWYFKGSSYNLKHRFNFRKSELSKKLENFDPNKTEWQNMKGNKWKRIWDCGNLVFEKKYS